jgi:hypothetical protein
LCVGAWVRLRMHCVVSSRRNGAASHDLIHGALIVGGLACDLFDVVCWRALQDSDHDEALSQRFMFWAYPPRKGRSQGCYCGYCTRVWDAKYKVKCPHLPYFFSRVRPEMVWGHCLDPVAQLVGVVSPPLSPQTSLQHILCFLSLVYPHPSVVGCGVVRWRGVWGECGAVRCGVVRWRGGVGRGVVGCGAVRCSAV